MTEKSKERIYREAKKRINMRKNGVHPSNYFEGWVVDYIDSVNTDELLVEKLQEQLNTAKKALTEIAEFDCSDDCYFTARDALAAIGGDDESLDN